jgi:hypothetical protein
MTMFSAIRKHFSYSNVAATLALVFALTGGAFAATSHSSGAGSTGAKASASVAHNTSLATAAKKKPASKVVKGPAGPKGATGATGATGPAGPVGATGPGGPQGPQGAAGANGTNGENGKEGATGKEGPKGKEGKEGALGTAGVTLPADASETGVWGFGQMLSTAIDRAGSLVAPVASFTVPLAAPLPIADAHYINEAGKEVIENGGLREEVENTGACKGGSAEKPIAEPGNLCVYGGEEIRVRASSSGFLTPSGGVGVGTAGAVEAFTFTTESDEGSSARGAWAVTAPAAS